MAQTVKLKRSSVAGNVPTPGQMETGELAMNTADGKLFLKDNILVRPIVTTGGWAGAVTTPLITGSIHLTGEVRAQNIVAETFVVSSSVYYNTQSFSSGSTIFGDTSDDTHQFTGSLLLDGDAFFDKWEPKRDLGTSYVNWTGNSTYPAWSITLNGNQAININEGIGNPLGRNVIINNGGENDFDFIVRGGTNDYLLNVDSSTDRVGIGVENPTARLHVSTNISSSDLQTSTLTSLTHIQTPYISSSGNLTVSSSNDLILKADDAILLESSNNTSPITVTHAMSSVNNARTIVTYKNDEKVLQYNSERYLLSQSNSLGVYKGAGMATISASIGSAFVQTVADFASQFVAVHMNYNAVGAQGGYVETGEFHIAYNQAGNSYNHQPKVLLAKNTSQTILNLTSSGYCNVSAQINSSFGPVEIMYEFTAFTQGII